MNSELIEIIVFVLPVLLYFLGWIKIKNINSIKPQIIFWILSIFVLFAFGFLSYENKHYNEISKLGNGILYTSSIILLGPALMLVKKKSEYITIGLLIILLPPLGIISIFFVLLGIGQITGT
jgi:hypothetical protein